jgi:hypothetical protein
MRKYFGCDAEVTSYSAGISALFAVVLLNETVYTSLSPFGGVETVVAGFFIN